MWFVSKLHASWHMFMKWWKKAQNFVHFGRLVAKKIENDMNVERLSKFSWIINSEISKKITKLCSLWLFTGYFPLVWKKQAIKKIIFIRMKNVFCMNDVFLVVSEVLPDIGNKQKISFWNWHSSDSFLVLCGQIFVYTKKIYIQV